MNFFEMRWPVEDPEVPQAELIEQAMEDLQVELPALGLRQLSAPVWSWVEWPKVNRFGGRFLIARFAVADIGRMGRL